MSLRFEYWHQRATVRTVGLRTYVIFPITYSTRTLFCRTLTVRCITNYV